MSSTLTLTVHGLSGTLESVFSTAWATPFAGEVAGSIVPVSGAAALAVAGIALVGWLRRRVR